MIQHLNYVASGGTVVPSDRPPAASTIKLAADYASKHGVTLAELKDWKWTPVDYQPYPRASLRPAFKFETESGPRYRFLDKGKQRFTHAQGYQICWYGLTDDVIASIDSETPLVICNGEISTVAGQTHLIPAVCITSGEKSRIPDTLLAALKEKIQPGARVIVAFDCDPTGRKAGPNMAAQLIEAGYDAWAVDLGLGDKGDLADFVVLHGAAAYQRLMECPHLAIPEQARPAFTPRPSAARPNKPANVSRDIEERADQRRHAWYKKAWDGIIRTLETTSRGRNTALFSAACKLFDLVESYPQYNSESAAYDALYNASSTNGYLAKDGRFAVNGAIKSAQRTPRQYVDMPFDPYDFSDAQRADRVGENAAQSRQENADLEQVFRPYNEHYTTLSIQTASPAGLTAAMVTKSRVLGPAVMKESRWIYDASARGVLPRYFTLTGDLKAAYQADGFKGEPPAQTYTKMLKLKILRRVPDELIDEMHLSFSSNNGCKTSINSGPGRRAAYYELASLSEYKQILFRPMARSLVSSYQPDLLRVIDPSLYPLMRHVLVKLHGWKKDYTVLNASIVKGFLNDDTKPLADELYTAIQSLPLGDASLLADIGYGDYIDFITSLNALFGDEMKELIALKDRVVLRLWQTHLDALDDPAIAVLPQSAPRIGSAGLSAFYNTLMMPHNGSCMWLHEVQTALDIENLRTAKRMIEDAAIILTPRYEHARRFTVKDDQDCTPQWDTVQAEARRTAKTVGEAGRPLYVRSYDRTGREIGAALINDISPDYWRVDPAGYFEVDVQLKYLVTVTDLAPAAAPIAEESPQEAIEALNLEEIRKLIAFLASVREIRRAARLARARRRLERVGRVTPARLNDDQWMLRRLLAPYCFHVLKGVWWNPLTGEIHETQKAAIDDLIDMASVPLAKAV